MEENTQNTAPVTQESLAPATPVTTEASDAETSTIKVLDVDLDAIQASESGEDNLDVTQYQGFRTNIAKVEVIEAINWYNKPSADGLSKVYNPESTEKMQKVRVVTKPLPVLDANGSATEELISLGDDKLLEVQARFNLMQNKDGNWTISKHPKAKLWQFMRKLNVEKLNDMVGKVVILTPEPAKDGTDKIYLRIVS